ncbi:CIA30 family protein [uncultured Algibacter sp.]|uniref:CIA30 family protein n=1 Tax=uncultured Algibacter sp. TaxID=298659 RepID=UPI0032166460
MKTLILLTVILLIQPSMMIFDFNTTSDIINWNIVDDVVMGGRSNGNFNINSAGYGEFHGKVSLENNGGFSMVQYKFNTKQVETFSKICLHIRGDRKHYQFRVKNNISDRHSYIVSFETTGDWQTINIPFSDLYPAYRGNTLDMKNYPGKTLDMIAFLIGNKKAEAFKLEIDSIVLK